jgi:hypothetical protein
MLYNRDNQITITQYDNVISPVLYNVFLNYYFKLLLVLLLQLLLLYYNNCKILTCYIVLLLLLLLLYYNHCKIIFSCYYIVCFYIL